MNIFKKDGLCLLRCPCFFLLMGWMVHHTGLKLLQLDSSYITLGTDFPFSTHKLNKDAAVVLI